jgi:hypothetical protein
MDIIWCYITCPCNSVSVATCAYALVIIYYGRSGTILNWGSLGIVVTLLWAGQPRNRGVVVASGKKSFFFSKVFRPALGPNPPSCSAGTGDFVPVGKVVGVQSSPLRLLPRSKINGAIRPHPCMLSWHGHGQLCLYQMCDKNESR